MKYAILALFLMQGTIVFAVPPGAESARIAKVLINVPAVLARLKKENTDSLTEVKITEVQSGLNDYELLFKRSCFCAEKTATVKVKEDLRPTYADGLPIYTGSVTFSK